MNARIYSRDEIDPKQWNRFLENSPQYIIYGLSGYLDCVCKNWRAIIVKQGEEWVAVMPLNISKKLGVYYSLKPPFVQYLGIFFKTGEEFSNRILSFKREVVEKIIDTLPVSVKLFNQNFSPLFDYFLPFTWQGFEVKPFNSYCLDIDKPLTEIHKNFTASARNRIRKAEKMELKCQHTNSITPLAELMHGRNIISAGESLILQDLWRFISKEERGFVLYVTNSETGQICCGGAFIYDRDRVIFLVSALDFQFKGTGANSMMIWQAIQVAKENCGVKTFDFTGSMIRGIENYIRSFGAEPVLYLNVFRNRLSIPYTLGLSIKEKIKKSRIVSAKDETVTVNKAVYLF